MQKLVKRFYYKVIYKERNMTTSREIAAVTISEVVDLAFKIYLLNWGVPPDSMTISRTNSYSVT